MDIFAGYESDHDEEHKAPIPEDREEGEVTPEHDSGSGTVPAVEEAPAEPLSPTPDEASPPPRSEEEGAAAKAAVSAAERALAAATIITARLLAKYPIALPEGVIAPAQAQPEAPAEHESAPDERPASAAATEELPTDEAELETQPEPEAAAPLAEEEIPPQQLASTETSAPRECAEKEGPGAEKSDSEEENSMDPRLRDLYVQGYACSVTRDDVAAQQLEEGEHLRPLQLSQNRNVEPLKLDRYDARWVLEPSSLSASAQAKATGPTKTETLTEIYEEFPDNGETDAASLQADLRRIRFRGLPATDHSQELPADLLNFAPFGSHAHGPSFGRERVPIDDDGTEEGRFPSNKRGGKGKGKGRRVAETFGHYGPSSSDAPAASSLSSGTALANDDAPSRDANAAVFGAGAAAAPAAVAAGNSIDAEAAAAAAVRVRARESASPSPTPSNATAAAEAAAAAAAEEEDDEPFEAPEGFELPEGVVAPSTLKMHTLIVGTAKTTRRSPQLEVLLRVREQNNAMLGFLQTDHELFPYYSFLRNWPEERLRDEYAKRLADQEQRRQERELEKLKQQNDALVQKGTDTTAAPASGSIVASPTGAEQIGEDPPGPNGVQEPAASGGGKSSGGGGSKSGLLGFDYGSSSGSDDDGDENGKQQPKPEEQQQNSLELEGGNVWEPEGEDKVTIDKMVLYAARAGSAFEEHVRVREGPGLSGRFGFLNPGHLYNAYYVASLEKARAEAAAAAAAAAAADDAHSSASPVKDAPVSISLKRGALVGAGKKSVAAAAFEAAAASAADEDGAEAADEQKATSAVPAATKGANESPAKNPALTSLAAALAAAGLPAAGGDVRLMGTSKAASAGPTSANAAASAGGGGDIARALAIAKAIGQAIAAKKAAAAAAPGQTEGEAAAAGAAGGTSPPAPDAVIAPVDKQAERRRKMKMVQGHYRLALLDLGLAVPEEPANAQTGDHESDLMAAEAVLESESPNEAEDNASEVLSTDGTGQGSASRKRGRSESRGRDSHSSERPPKRSSSRQENRNGSKERESAQSRRRGGNSKRGSAERDGRSRSGGRSAARSSERAPVRRGTRSRSRSRSRSRGSRRRARGDEGDSRARRGRSGSWEGGGDRELGGRRKKRYLDR